RIAYRAKAPNQTPLGLNVVEAVLMKTSKLVRGIAAVAALRHLPLRLRVGFAPAPDTCLCPYSALEQFLLNFKRQQSLTNTVRLKFMDFLVQLNERAFIEFEHERPAHP